MLDGATVPETVIVPLPVRKLASLLSAHATLLLPSHHRVLGSVALHVPLPEFEAALPAAVAWELTRIKETGEVDVTGNTRTGVGKEIGYTGQPKKVNYTEVVLALTFYGLVHQDPAALAAADRVFAYSQRQ